MPSPRCATTKYNKTTAVVPTYTLVTLLLVCITTTLESVSAFSSLHQHQRSKRSLPSSLLQRDTVPSRLSYGSQNFLRQNNNNKKSFARDFVPLSALKSECDGGRGPWSSSGGLRRVIGRCFPFGGGVRQQQRRRRRQRKRGGNGIMGYYLGEDSYRPRLFRRDLEDSGSSSRNGKERVFTLYGSSSSEDMTTIQNKSEVTLTNFGIDVLTKLNATNNNGKCQDGEEDEVNCVIITDEEEQAKEEELSKSAKIVQEAVQEVTQSVKELGGTFVDQAPSVFAIIWRSIVSREMRQDILRVRKNYVSDWVDAFKNKRQVIPSILFLYFACVAPAVSFGTIASQITNGNVGVVEFLLSSGLSGMAYALLCGQPMAFVAPTGLTLAFTSGLFSFCTLNNLPFFPVYSWVGIWTSIFMVSLGMCGASKFIRFCTHFTDEVFNALLSFNFIFEALSSLRRNFQLADPENLTMPFVSLAMALVTFWSTMKVIAFDSSIYFSKKVRTIVKDFGPVAIIVAMSILNLNPWLQSVGVPTLAVSNTFQLAGGRHFMIPIMSVPVAVRLLCSLPAVLLTALFFMDQNISVRLVNKPENGLKKGPAYNVDMVALGIITGGLSMVGLPWMCGATVQSMNHVRAMTKTKFNEESQTLEIESVTETRLSGFVIHTMIASTVLLLPAVQFLPIPVVSGVFLFLGRKLMTGNSFLRRVKDSICEQGRLPEKHPMNNMGRKKVNAFTTVQVACLIGLWKVKQFPTTAMFFPSVIALLMVIRSYILPRWFTEDEFIALGDPSPTFKKEKR